MGTKLSDRMTLNLGSIWHEKFYQKIRDSLQIDEESDRRAAEILSRLVSGKSRLNPDGLASLIHGKSVIVFGAGPSVEEDIAGVHSVLTSGKLVIIAADGAADAMRSRSVASDIVVSDLDSCSIGELISVSENAVLIVHAHGDNIKAMNEIVPRLHGNLLGSTQIEPRENVCNYGGFTDGDRACYIAAGFEPRSIAIAGMDFGDEEGRFSKSRRQEGANHERGKAKLEWGKSSLEFLTSLNLNIRFRNLTKFGQEIAGAPKMSYAEFISEFS